MTHSGPVLGRRDGLTVLECRVCGYAHLETLPDAEELAAYYRDEFWQADKPSALADFERYAEWWSAVHGDWLELMRNHVLAEQPSLLDVGSGFGQFLERAQDAGWQPTGIEPSNEVRGPTLKRRGIATYKMPWIDATWTGLKPFDALSVLWLLEHLPDPLAFLRWCRERLYAGGVLLVVVPNDFSAIQMQVNGHVAVPNWWIHKSHTVYLNWSSLSNLLGMAGFKIVERLGTYPMEDFLLAHDYTNDTELGTRLHEKRVRFDISMSRSERIEHYRQLARRYEGRECVVLAVPDG